MSNRSNLDILRFALTEAVRDDIASQVYDFSLALELGVSTQTGQSLVEFCLSRIVAYPDEQQTPADSGKQNGWKRT